MKKYIFISIVWGMLFSKAQIPDSLKIIEKVVFSGYAEFFFTHDFNEPTGPIRQNFLYSYNRHDHLNLNLGLIKASYQARSLRAKIALMSGTYAHDNMANEKKLLRYISEANIGVKISGKKNIWIDAGIMPSHIGWETHVGKDNFNLTRSLAAENSPYFETGAKVSYTSDNDKWFLSLLILNGWQRILIPKGLQTLSFGHQLIYKPTEGITLNSSSFIGNDKAKEEKKMRYFHDLYGSFQLTKKISALIGFDIGAEQKDKANNKYGIWYSPNILIRYELDKKWTLAGRLEYYYDKNNVIINTETENGFQTFGYSMNIDYGILKNMIWRTEARSFNSKDAIFVKNNTSGQTNIFITTSLNIGF